MYVASFWFHCSFFLWPGKQSQVLHIRFNVCFPRVHELELFLWVITSMISHFTHLFTRFPPSKSLFIISFCVFLGYPLGKLPSAPSIWHSVDQKLPSVIYRRPDVRNLLFCKQSIFLIFNLSLSPGFTVENPYPVIAVP